MVTQVRAIGLPDTGQELCDNGANVLEACSYANTGVAAIYLGQAGVTRALEIIQKELDLTMAFCGRTDINQVDKSILLPGTY